VSAIVVRYQTRAAEADLNQTLVEAVFEQPDAEQPDGVRYTCLRLADDTFIHIADISNEPNPLSNLDTFVAFSSTIGERCDPGNGPNPQPATTVGNFQLPA
jgi:hypothetical protein